MSQAKVDAAQTVFNNMYNTTMTTFAALENPDLRHKYLQKLPMATLKPICVHLLVDTKGLKKAALLDGLIAALPATFAAMLREDAQGPQRMPPPAPTPTSTPSVEAHQAPFEAGPAITDQPSPIYDDDDEEMLAMCGDREEDSAETDALLAVDGLELLAFIGFAPPSQ
jgi:hypothetical protein